VSTPKTITVMLACNDYRNGNFQGFIEQVQLLDLIELEGDPLRVSFSRGPKNPLLVVEPGLLIQTYDHKEWVGNWCWDAVRLSIPDTFQLLEHLRAQHWSCLEAEVSLMDAWENKAPMLEYLREVVRTGAKISREPMNSMEVPWGFLL
jgi:hypothetical protein